MKGLSQSEVQFHDNSRKTQTKALKTSKWKDDKTWVDNHSLQKSAITQKFLWNTANWPLEKTNERKETEKKTLFFQKPSTSWKSKKKIEGLKAVWICRIICDTHFLKKLTQFEKTESIGITFISLGNLIIISIFEIKSRSFSWPLHFCCLIVEFAFF